MNEVDLPGFRSTFHGVEVAIDYDKDKVYLSETICQLDIQHLRIDFVPTAKSATKLVCLRLSRCLRNERGARMIIIRQIQTRSDKAQSGRRVSGEPMSWCIAATTLGIKLLMIIR